MWPSILSYIPHAMFIRLSSSYWCCCVEGWGIGGTLEKSVVLKIFWSDISFFQKLLVGLKPVGGAARQGL